MERKQKCIKSLHEVYSKNYPERKILEISSKSLETLGVALSAFNLMYKYRDKNLSIESVFQGSKVFENGEQYVDIYEKSAIEAKKDNRIRESGKLICFRMFGEDFPLEPRNYFYTWLYISALSRYPEYIKKLICYDSFTDIEFNPKKSLNCQAMAVAMCVGLLKAGKYEEATQRKEKFLHIVYGEELLKDWKQMTLFD